tara:strand:- start:2169 stop:2576 length:408 start_codon:yes stop_codon:yes gene_type:complete
MSLSSAILTQLNTSTALVAAVSGRMSPYVRNAATQEFPAVVFEINTTSIQTDTIGLVEGCKSEATITALSRSYIEADSVAADILTAMAGWTSSTDCVAICAPQSVDRDQETPYDGSQDLVYRCSITFSIDHGEAI